MTNFLAKRGWPTMADRAFFYSLQHLTIEWIAYRMGVTQGQAQRLVREGMERAAVKEAAE